MQPVASGSISMTLISIMHMEVTRDTWYNTAGETPEYLQEAMKTYSFFLRSEVPFSASNTLKFCLFSLQSHH